MASTDDSVHITIRVDRAEQEVIRGLMEEVEFFSRVGVKRSGHGVPPEVLVAVVTGGSVVLRQFIMSLFDYLKARQRAVTLEVGDRRVRIEETGHGPSISVDQAVEAIELAPRDTRLIVATAKSQEEPLALGSPQEKPDR